MVLPNHPHDQRQHLAIVPYLDAEAWERERGEPRGGNRPVDWEGVNREALRHDTASLGHVRRGERLTLAAMRGTNAPTFGIEEEFLLSDSAGLQLREDADDIRDAALARIGEGVDHELRSAMLETGTAVCRDAASARQDLLNRRQAINVAARAAGARVLATASHPLIDPDTVGFGEDTRYQTMRARYGRLANQALVCGCHVHVGVPDRQAGVEIINRIRPWLAPLIALSANSPFWQRQDTGYDSWRSRVWSRWPTAGPTSPFASLEAYEERADLLVASGAAIDRGMLYYDARLSESWPTVEVRVADVCLDVEDSVLMGVLVRALVMTAHNGQVGEVASAPVEVLRAAAFAASRTGLHGDLLDPLTWAPRPAHAVIDRLMSHVGVALEATGDVDGASAAVAEIFHRGNGATQQRQAWSRGGADAVADLVALR
jgi:carboxylate-amine ligase